MFVDDLSKRQVASLKFVLSAEKSMLISAPKDEVFTVLSQRGHLESFHPFCKENLVFAWEAENRRDRIIYNNGRVLDRQFISWAEGEGFELLIGESVERRSLVSWSLEVSQPAGCMVHIAVKPHLYAGLSAPAAAVIHKAWIRKSLVRYLESVLLGLKHFCETGEKVEPNKWGVHPWFSTGNENLRMQD
jgi:hypothetical protein